MQSTDNSASSKILPVVVSQRELRECHRGLLHLLTDWLTSAFVMFDLIAWFDILRIIAIQTHLT